MVVAWSDPLITRTDLCKPTCQHHLTIEECWKRPVGRPIVCHREKGKCDNLNLEHFYKANINCDIYF